MEITECPCKKMDAPFGCAGTCSYEGIELQCPSVPTVWAKTKTKEGEK